MLLSDCPLTKSEFILDLLKYVLKHKYITFPYFELNGYHVQIKIYNIDHIQSNNHSFNKTIPFYPPNWNVVIGITFYHDESCPWCAKKKTCIFPTVLSLIFLSNIGLTLMELMWLGTSFLASLDVFWILCTLFLFRFKETDIKILDILICGYNSSVVILMKYSFLKPDQATQNKTQKIFIVILPYKIIQIPPGNSQAEISLFTPHYKDYTELQVFPVV